MVTEGNPLLEQSFDARLDEIQPRHVGPATDAAIARLRAVIETVTANGTGDYASVVAPVDAARDRIERVIGWAHHRLAVTSDSALQAAFEDAEARASAFLAGVDMHEGLFQAVAALEHDGGLRPIERRRVEEMLRDFRRMGVALPADRKERLQALRTRLSELATRFERNVLEATRAWTHHLTDEAAVAGLPDWARAVARSAAAERGLDGWLLTLQQPMYQAVLRYAERRALRETLYHAHATLASSGEHDNRPLVRAFLETRLEIARILGYAHLADLNTEDRMAKSGANALDFVIDLTNKTEPYFRADVADVEAHARSLGIETLRPWDISFVIERLRRERIGFEEEALRPYLPLPRVERGLFEIIRRVFGLHIEQREPPHAWHPTVRYFDVSDEAGTHIGSFYADFFPRENKRAGAWMNEFWIGGPGLDGDGRAPHLGFVGGNFTPSADPAAPALLSLDDVLTLAHEVGHCLHLLTSEVAVPALAGTHVAWDFIELPSQLLENWIWERDAFDLVAGHHKTGEPVPDALYAAMEADRRFMAGYYQMRQLAYGRIDLELHMHLDPERDDPFDFARRTLERYHIHPDFVQPLSLCSFRHLFGNGYDAGYYSYKWSEVLEADIFRRFKERGIFDRALGRSLIDTILSRGDADEPDTLFRDFMGRDPDPSALFERTFGSAA